MTEYAERDRDFEAEALAIIPRNKREKLLFYVERFRDVDLGHVRIFVPSKDGALTPTGKGITVTAEHINAFSEGVQKLAEKLRTAKGTV